MVDEVEVRCPKCRRFLVAVPPGTPVRARCRDCSMTFERVAQTVKVVTTIDRVRVREIGMS